MCKYVHIYTADTVVVYNSRMHTCIFSSTYVYLSCCRIMSKAPFSSASPSNSLPNLDSLKQVFPLFPPSVSLSRLPSFSLSSLSRSLALSPASILAFTLRMSRGHVTRCVCCSVLQSLFLCYEDIWFGVCIAVSCVCVAVFCSVMQSLSLCHVGT